MIEKLRSSMKASVLLFCRLCMCVSVYIYIYIYIIGPVIIGISGIKRGTGCRE
jgi:hypothetical protein